MLRLSGQPLRLQAMMMQDYEILTKCEAHPDIKNQAKIAFYALR